MYLNSVKPKWNPNFKIVFDKRVLELDSRIEQWYFWYHLRHHTHQDPFLTKVEIMLMKRGFIDFDKKLIQEYTIVDIMEEDEVDGVYFCGNCPSCSRANYHKCLNCSKKRTPVRPVVYYNKDKKIINPSLIQILLSGEDAPYAERDYAEKKGSRLEEFTPRRLKKT